MTDLELFKEAVKVDRGNLTALRKLADLEFQNEMFLEAALSYEKIKDFLSADQCYEEANAAAESHEQMGDYLVRRSLMNKDIDAATENYMKAISHLSQKGK